MPPKQSTESKVPNPAAAATQLANDAAELQNYGLKALSGTGIAWVEALSDMGSEVLSFVSDRIKEDVKTQHEMLHCRDVAELQHLQAQFVQKAVDQYTAETGKLVKMSQDMFASTAAQAGKSDK